MTTESVEEDAAIYNEDTAVIVAHNIIPLQDLHIKPKE